MITRLMVEREVRSLKKPFLVGIICALAGAAAGAYWGNWSLTAKICGYIGLGSLLLAGIFEGSYISGDRLRANYATETREDRNVREKISGFLFIMSLPSLLAAILLYFGVLQ